MDMLPGPWSVAGASGGFSVEGELSMEPRAPAPAAAPIVPQNPARKSQRVPVEMGAALRQRGAAGVSVQIMDLSVDGFRVATHLDLFEGSDVWLRLGGLEACHAKVVWVSGHLVGCRFSRPLHPAVLDMVVAKGKTR
ncbi:MAG: PilZ domain-containing protein [Allosphingosinicella sp.]